MGHLKGEKLSTLRGVYCSNMKSTANNSYISVRNDTSKPTSDYQWQCSSTHNHNEYSPIFAANNINTNLLRRKIEQDRGRRQNRKVFRNNEENEVRFVFQKIVAEKGRELPKQSIQFNSCHVLVNNERLKMVVLPLYRDTNLDKLAFERAKKMASQGYCEHSNANDFMSKKLGLVPFRRIGENVCRGNSLETIHNKIISDRKFTADKNNILDRRFSSFGVGLATSSNGEIYMCQIFKG